VSASDDNSYHQIECHENVPAVSKNGDHCNELVALYSLTKVARWFLGQGRA
jgi:hypothetical protein